MAVETQEPLLRRTREADLDTLLPLMEEFYEYEKRTFTAEKVSALAGLLRDSSLGWVALICDGGGAAGYIVLTYGYSIEYHGRDLLVDDLYLRPEYRGRGWGTWVLGEVEKISRRQGLQAPALGSGAVEHQRPALLRPGRISGTRRRVHVETAVRRRMSRCCSTDTLGAGWLIPLS